MESKTKCILVVEDNPDDEALTLRALKKSKIKNETHVVRDGQEALDFLFQTGAFSGEASRPLPTVVLLDLKLPKVDGLEVLRRLRAHQRTKRLPIVVLTSSSQEDDLIHSYDNGANSVVRKPVEFSQFAESVRQLGLYWMVINEQPPQ